MSANRDPWPYRHSMYHECLTLPCPYCGVGVDEPCEEARTGRQRGPHMKRFRAWKKLETALGSSQGAGEHR